MHSTPIFGIPAPDGGDTPDGAAQLQAIAEKADALLAGEFLQSGVVTIDKPYNTLPTESVQFPRPYAHNPVHVVLSITRIDPIADRTSVTVDNVTKTGFDIRLYDNNGNPRTFDVAWIAAGAYV